LLKREFNVNFVPRNAGHFSMMAVAERQSTACGRQKVKMLHQSLDHAQFANQRATTQPLDRTSANLGDPGNAQMLRQ